MGKKIKVLPTTVRIENIELLDFLKDLPEVLKNIPELADIRANAVTLVSSKANISMSYVSPDSFNMSGPSPEILQRFVEAIEAYYQGKIR